MADVRRIVESIAAAAKRAGVTIVTGDTKVVDRGKGDGVYVNTAGIGIVETDLAIGPSSVQPGDVVIASGDLGRHGIAIMAKREGLEFETTIESDCAPLWSAVDTLLSAGIEVHCLRDLTRGGLATALCEISEKSGLTIRIDEAAMPVREDVRGACEILGLDPLYVANEGRFCAIVASKDADRALELLKTDPECEGASLVGRVSDERRAAGLVTMRSLIGVDRIVDMLSGEQLPRIC